MGALSKSDKYAIMFLHNQNKDMEAISNELGITIAQVKRIISSLSKNSDVKTAPAKSGDKTKDLIIRQTAAKKNGGVSIMTEGAAQLSDEFTKKLPPNTKNTDNYIFRRPE